MNPTHLLATVAIGGALGAISLSLNQVPQPAPVCHARADLVGPCVTVHGALRYYNGGTPVRIWMIGTARLLGVWGLDETGRPESPAVCPLPQGLRDTLEAGKEVIADFRVCPLTRRRSGVMQRVCVDSASHLRAKPYRF